MDRLIVRKRLQRYYRLSYTFAHPSDPVTLGKPQIKVVLIANMQTVGYKLRQRKFARSLDRRRQVGASVVRHTEAPRQLLRGRGNSCSDELISACGCVWRPEMEHSRVNVCVLLLRVNVHVLLLSLLCKQDGRTVWAAREGHEGTEESTWGACKQGKDGRTGRSGSTWGASARRQGRTVMSQEQ